MKKSSKGVSTRRKLTGINVLSTRETTLKKINVLIRCSFLSR